jgi:hypothetical protein
VGASFFRLPKLFITLLGSCLSDPLVSYGRHFGRTVHALANVQALVTNGLLRMGELAGEPEEAFTSEYFHCFEIHIPLSSQVHL